MDENKKAIYSYKEVITIEEWKKMFKCIPRFYWSYTINVASWLLVASIILSLYYNYSLFESILTFCVIFLPIALIYKVKIEWLAERVYNLRTKKGSISKKSIVDFYEDFLIKKADNLHFKLRYSEIKKIYETDTNIYLDSRTHVINVRKSECNYDILNLLKKSKEQMENTNSNSQKKTFNLNKFLLIIYIFTILSIFGALITLSVAVGNKPFIIAIRKLWLCWIWLPIPIISLFLGIKFRNVNIKFKKNIVSGIIASLFLLILGSFAFSNPSFEIEYENINKFNEILNIKFPKNGILTKETYEVYLNQNMTDVEIYRAYYDKSEELENFINQLKNNSYWKDTKEISSELKKLVPTDIEEHLMKPGYLLVYNENDKNYNELPKHEGVYNICMALYLKEEKNLIISVFKYNYE